jgi:hypothetical protein
VKIVLKPTNQEVEEMKYKAVVLMVVTALLIISIGATGCELGAVNEFLGDEGGDTPTPEGVAAELMAVVPEQAEGFILFDIQALRQDSDLSAAYQELEADIGGPDKLGLVGLELSEVEMLGMAGEGELVLVKGDFDIDEVESALQNAGFEQASYRGIIVWALGTEDVLLIALDGLVIGGSEYMVKECAKVMAGEEHSLFDDKDYREVLGALPEAMVIMCQRGDLFGDGGDDHYYDDNYDGYYDEYPDGTYDEYYDGSYDQYYDEYAYGAYDEYSDGTYDEYADEYGGYYDEYYDEYSDDGYYEDDYYDDYGVAAVSGMALKGSSSGDLKIIAACLYESEGDAREAAMMIESEDQGKDDWATNIEVKQEGNLVIASATMDPIGLGDLGLFEMMGGGEEHSDYNY